MGAIGLWASLGLVGPKGCLCIPWAHPGSMVKYRKWLLASSLFISSILGPVVGVLDVGGVDLNTDTLSDPAGVAGVPLGFRET